MSGVRVSRETAVSEGASAVPPRRDGGRGTRARPLPSDALPSPPLARALCRSVVGGAHLSPGVGVAGGGDARSHGEDGFALGRDRGCDGRPAVHRVLRYASGAARFVGNVLTGGCERAVQGMARPCPSSGLVAAPRMQPSRRPRAVAGCPLPPRQTSSPSVTCRESGARAEHESECRRGGARPVCQSACARGDVSGDGTCCDSSELEGPIGGA